MPLNIPLGAFQKWASCLPDVVALQRLCLFHHFSLVFVLLLWLDRLCSEIMQLFVCFKHVYCLYFWLCSSPHQVFYFENWLPALCRVTVVVPGLASVQTEFSMEQRGGSPLGWCWDELWHSCWKQEQATISSGDCVPAQWKLGGYSNSLSPNRQMPAFKSTTLNPQHPLSSLCVSLLCKLMQKSSYYD